MSGFVIELLKRVIILYRVSTKKQYDKLKDDIPMQKKACHEFVEQHGWTIVDEVYEKGVSGYKVSANDRDAIQQLKQAAINNEFDVLLVYMFERIGRIDDETPFVVEWFIKHGIEVWSTQEGQQRLDNQGDKIVNYVRFLQANTESEKTSMRLKTVTAQMTEAGEYRGGATPFGYNSEHCGRVNKRGQYVKDLVIVHEEAKYVKMIFDKTLYEGYGSHQLAEYMNSLGVKTHNGSRFQVNTINRILRNKLYCGYYVAGESVSPKIDRLVIIEENVFDAVQKILDQRMVKNEEKRSIARTTKGRTLLSGNIFCGHCGGRLISTSCDEKFERADGTTGRGVYLRYSCYHRARKLNDCDGQSIYSARQVDEMVTMVVEKYLERIKQTPKDKALEIRYQQEINTYKKIRRELSDKRDKLKRILEELTAEVGRSLTGESSFLADVLAMSINATKDEMREIENSLEANESEIDLQKSMLDKIDFYYDQFVSWAYEFHNAPLQQQKMIICQLIKSIKVSRGYSLEIEFNASYRQFFGDETCSNEVIKKENICRV